MSCVARTQFTMRAGVVVMCGAGMSAGAKVPTFSKPRGVYNKV